MKTPLVVVGMFIAGAALAAAPAPASAAPITFNFEVQVTSFLGVAASAFPGLAVGDLIAGQYTFDSGAVDGNAGAQFGRFDFNAPAGAAAASITIEGRTLSWTGSRIDTFDSPSLDFYRFQQRGTFIPDPLITASDFLGQLIGPAALLAGPGLPLTPPDVALAQTTSFLLNVETQEGDGNILGSIRSFSAAPVATAAEPTSMLLLGSGLSLLAARVRGARRRS